MSAPTAFPTARDAPAQSVLGRPRVRVFAGVLGLSLLWQAVQFGGSGSWPLAVLFFLLFGGVQSVAFAAVPRKASLPRGNEHAV